MKHKQEGFTLVELGFSLVKLMIIVSIISVLTEQDRIKKSKVSEANTLFAGFKTEIMNIYSDKGIYPDTTMLKNGGVVFQGTYSTATYDDAMAVAGTPQVCFKVMGFEANQDNICWKYAPSTKDVTQRVWHCRKEQVPPTTIADQYLPKNCKSTAAAL